MLAVERSTVVTGAASGVGRETVNLLRADGHRVIGVDMSEADVVADLSTEAGRRTMVTAVEDATGGSVDAVIACAGVLTEDPNAVSVNFFGAIHSLGGLRPLLERSASPRGVVISSVTLLSGWLAPLVEACLELDEAKARAVAAEHETDYQPGNSRIYSSTKRALSLWVRRVAVTPEWAGRGILLNAVAPCGINTPMAQKHFTEDTLRTARDMSPLHRSHAEPEEIARLLVYLVSEGNSLILGQTIYVDAGFEALRRPDHV